MISFVDFANINGLLIKSLLPSDRIQRCPTALHPRSRNGAYLWDGERGGVMAWDGDATWNWFKGAANTCIDWSKKKQSHERELELSRQQAAKNAYEIVKNAKQNTHGYLMLKGFKETCGMVDADDQLIIPMFDYATKKLSGVQRISWDGEVWNKKMLYGMKAKGAMHCLGSHYAGEKWLCEGYATALSIKAAMARLSLNSVAVVACFSANNLKYLSDKVSGKVYVFADHDKSGVGQQVAESTGLPWVMSPNMGQDANDLHHDQGILAVCKLIMEARAK